MKKVLIVIIAIAASAFAQQDVFLSNMVQPDYVSPCSALTATNGICTLKIGSNRAYAKALYLHPKCDTGKFIYVNSMSIPVLLNYYYPQKLIPGEWVGIMTGIIDTTGTGVNLDSIWWARKEIGSY